MFPTPLLLSAFRHPLVLLSVLTLLVNDHLLKTANPSWLTGKLSDFSGLFFFPFLVGVLLQGVSGLQGRARLSSRAALLASMAACGGLFGMLKTVPQANALTARLLEQLYSGPVNLALDPTDLLALLMFLPAWKLWVRLERMPRPAAAGRLGYAVLSLGALASIASSPCPYSIPIQHIVAMDGDLYAGQGYQNRAAYISSDQGETWTYLEEIPFPVEAEFSEPAYLPIIRCDPLQPLTCYRIDGRPQVEESNDGGLTWRTTWELPPGRESFIRRAAWGRSVIFSCGKIVDLKTYDIVLLPGYDWSLLVVAMGNEGLLLHPANGDWQRAGLTIGQTRFIASSSVGPTPYLAQSLSDAFDYTKPEWYSALGLVYFLYLGLCIWAWNVGLAHAQPNAAHPVSWVKKPLKALLIWSLVSILGIILGIASHSGLIILGGLGFLALPLVILVVVIMTLQRAGQFVAQPAKFRRFGWWALLAAVSIFAVYTGCFLLWALGTLTTYESAQALTIVLVPLMLIVSIVRLNRLVRAAVGE